MLNIELTINQAEVTKAAIERMVKTLRNACCEAMSNEMKRVYGEEISRLELALRKFEEVLA
jgi:hypothetical protein